MFLVFLFFWALVLGLILKSSIFSKKNAIKVVILEDLTPDSAEYLIRKEIFKNELFHPFKKLKIIIKKTENPETQKILNILKRRFNQIFFQS